MIDTIKNTCRQLLNQRGYIIEHETEYLIVGIPSIQTNNYYYHPTEKICIFLDNITNDFNVSKSSEYIIKLKQININHCIIIYKEKITSVAKKISDSINEFTIELFPVKELMYNITSHYLVPLHKKLSYESAKDFIKTYESTIPVILVKDPVSKFYGFKKKDIIEIERNSGYITYRIVK